MPNVREGGECIHSLHSFLFIKNWYTRILANKLLLESDLQITHKIWTNQRAHSYGHCSTCRLSGNVAEIICSLFLKTYGDY